MAKHEQTVDDGIGAMDSGLTPEELTSLRNQGVEPSTTEDAPDPESIFDPNEVKGPDPAIWGDDADRPSNNPTMATSTVGDDGQEIEVKGPDPEQWGDAS